MNLGADPYDILGVGRLANDEEIRGAYRSLARTLHPDANPGDTDAASRFAAVTAAYDVLHDPVRRRAYDLARATMYGPRAARAAPAPTGDTTVRGPGARPSHRPRSTEPDPAPPERDEFAFLGRLIKVVLIALVLFLVAMLFAGLNGAPECGRGVDPAFCRPAPSGAP